MNTTVHLFATLIVTACLVAGIHAAQRRRRAMQQESAREVARWISRLSRHVEAP